MQLSEAERWIRDSVVRQPVFHVTTQESAASIRQTGFDLSRRHFGHAWGEAVYTTPDQEVVALYTSATAS
jgi:hypothetical protein